MSEHVADSDLKAFVDGTAGLETMTRIDLHLESCESCRERSAVLLGGSERADALLGEFAPASMHLTDDDLLAYVQGRVTSEPLALIEQHLAGCDVCATQVSELRGWARSQPASRSRAFWMGAAAAALLAVAVLLPNALRLLRTSAARGGSEALVVPDDLSAEERTLVETVAAQNPGPLPPVLQDLHSSTEVVLGAVPEQPKFRLTSPVGTAVTTATPTLAWQPLNGATSYRVSVFEERGQLVARSEELRQPLWMPAEPLPRETTLVWQVSAIRGSEVVTEPSAPAPPARFRVIGEAAGARLSVIERTHPDQHLILGILYRNAGLLEEARAQLLKVSPTDRDAPLAARMLAQFEGPTP